MNDAEKIAKARRWCEANGKRPHHFGDGRWYWYTHCYQDVYKPHTLPNPLRADAPGFACGFEIEDAAYLALDAALEACKAAVGLDEDTIALAAVNALQPAIRSFDWSEPHGAESMAVHVVAAAIRKLKGTSHADQ